MPRFRCDTPNKSSTLQLSLAGTRGSRHRVILASHIPPGNQKVRCPLFGAWMPPTYDPTNVANTSTKTDTFDSTGNLLTETVPYGSNSFATTTYTYNNGQLASLTDSLGNTTTYGYNAYGQQITTTTPTGTVTNTYDDLGRVASILDANGRLETFEYDEAGQLHTETWYAGSTSGTTCTGPNSDRSCCQIKTVWILGWRRAVYRIPENFGEGSAVRLDEAGNLATRTADRLDQGSQSDGHGRGHLTFWLAGPGIR